MTLKKFLIIAIFLSVLVAGGLSSFASSSPDGLEKVSADKGLDANVTDSAVSGSIFADYSVSGLENSTWLAGIIGLAITALLGIALVKWVAKK